MTDQGGDGSWIRGLARTWIYTSVQEVSNRGKRAQYSCGTTRLGAECEEVASEVPVRVRMWVQGLGRGWAAVQCAAVQSDYAVKACVGAAKLSVTGVQ